MISLKSSSSTSSSLNSDFHGHRFLVQELEGIPKKGNIQYCSFSLNAQMKTGIIGETQKWWEKGLQPNMKEVKGAQDLVESLFNAGDTLVVVDFFSPGCGGCKALHPKIKKFKDALAKHSQNYCSLGPPKGLEKKELIALAANKDLSFNYTPKPEQPTSVPPTLEEILAETAQTPPSHSEAEPSVSPPLPLPLPLPLATGSNAAKGTEDKTLVASGSRLRRMRMASQIKKFKDALAKHSQNCCSLGPPKGLEKKELIALAANKDLSFNYKPKPEQLTPVPPTLEEILAETAPTLPSHSEVEPSVSPPLPLPIPLATSSNAAKGIEDKTLVASGRRLRRMRTFFSRAMHCLAISSCTD
ncbi:thioredoxin-like 1-1, chloroplastic isoform X2 [Camellia sinensis]|uniref:thioredoxin-like 1-1, chloroplastic isoform X2 n=1 Tax=Camellia sinensis TaxID=4442 RepID=UPI001035BB58|nr:thioredoxin-like 1-1, chloroplastic isoform X2 [Camellia sinensis]